ncbi:unnamed protein product [Oppiella nova]|uniref:J domain-containing protein n=1 Tax=Oppiella nova TaxID=334625 RepID=A0A7R9LJY5_9ACAR|nr:unnamed protein product [Oppiella nova]CAG2164392.1 unnamed protein product [Oppiella nova]
MDGNRDESERCIRLAKTLIAQNETQKAIKFLMKAQRLFPSQEANDKSNLNSNSNASYSHTSHGPTSGGGGGGSHREYTDEQLAAVKQIKKCKDYYEILGVTKEAVDSDVKKQYRKLALQFHPDKNKAPGAAEAFKMIGTAFAVLSDAQKRKQYDMYGSEEEQRKRSQTQYYENGYYDYNRGFDGDINADEIFNMFFGGGFPSGNVYVRRTNNRYRETHRHHNNQTQEVASGYNVLLQMMPVLVLLCLSLMSTFFVSDPTYSLSRTQKYSYERKTQNLEVPYFVKENFERENKGSIRRIEQQVEEDYVSNLRASCFRERNYKESMIWRARNFRDKDLEDRAKGLKTPSCDHLHKISQQYVLW